MKTTTILIFGILLILDFGNCSHQNEKRDLQSLFNSILGQLNDDQTTTTTPNEINTDDLSSVLGSGDETTLPISNEETAPKTSTIEPTEGDGPISTTTIRPTTTPNRVISTTANKASSTTARKASSTTRTYYDNLAATDANSGLTTTLEPTNTPQYNIPSETTTKPTPGPLESTTKTELLPPLPICEVDDILSAYCPDLPPALSTLSFWDIYYTFFSDMVLEALLLNCSSGHWCLRDRFNDFEAILMEKTEMVMTSEVFTDVCQEVTERCLQNVVDMTSECSTYERTNFTKEAIDLICKLKKDENLDINCFEELLISLHVTVIDILRDQNTKQQTVEAGFVDDTCKTPEAEMSKTFVCLEGRCPGHSTDLANFRNWKWFSPDVQVLQDECDFEDDTCNSKYRTVSPVEANTHQIGIAWTEPVSMHTMIGISVGTFVSVIALTVVVYLCWKSHLKAKKSKEGYSPLRNDEP